MKKTFLILFAVMAFQKVFSQEVSSDSAQIRKTAMNYMEGWYTGNADRMRQALHPDLVKRIILTVDTVSGRQYLSGISADMLVQFTGTGYGKRMKGANSPIDYTLLDQNGPVAMVRIKTSDFVDYLQLGKVNNEWKIINALWLQQNGKLR